MNINESHSDYFDQYLRGLLGDEENAAFEKQLEDDAVFAEMFKVHRILVEGIKDSGRAELKSFLAAQTTGMSYKPKFKINRLYYAAAATVVLFIGLYFIFRSFTNEIREKSMAVETPNEQHIMKADSIAIADSKAHDESPIVADVGTVKSEETVGLASKEAAVEMEHDFSEMKDAAPEIDASSSDDDVKLSKLGYTKVLSETKLADTIISIPALALLEIDKTQRSNDYYSATKASKSKSSTYPANASNAGNQVANKNLSKQDTAMSNGKFNAATEKDQAASSKTLIVEYWSSPVNFVGYNLVDNSIRLYGISVHAARIYMYDTKIYLRINGNVYLLRECEKACAFEAETNNEIVNLILRQN